MRVKNKKTYQLKKRTIITDSEGGKYPDFAEPIEINANIYPASGKLEAEIYGERLSYMLNMLYDESEEIAEGDRVIYDNSNYKVISIKKYSHHKLITLEKEHG